MKIKNKLLSLASILVVSNVSAIEIGPTGSGIELSGFVDLYFKSQSKVEETEVGQVEIDLDWEDGPVSVSVDFDLYDSNGSGSLGSRGATLEEAIITYDFGNGFSVTGGKRLSYLGFEAYDPINMYQYSYAYDAAGGPQDIYDAYDEGFSIDYAGDMFSVGIFTSAEQDGGFEYALALTGVENLTVKAIWADWDAYETTTFWASYQLDKLLLAAEVAEKDNTTGTDIEGWLIMGNYSVNDALALTLRYSEEEVGTTDYEKFTISPSYAFTESLSGRVEYSNYSSSVAASKPGDLLAVEIIFTF